MIPIPQAIALGPIISMIMPNFRFVDIMVAFTITSPPGPICHKVPTARAKTHLLLIYNSITVPGRVVFHIKAPVKIS